MTDLAALIANGPYPLVIPGAHDALSARMIAAAGFKACGIGGAGIAAAQLGLPDIGVQSFGEHRDAIRRVQEATDLPLMVDGENGFGDAKAVTRTIRAFDAMGVGGVALEDLVFPPRLGAPPAVIAPEDMTAKLAAALAARRNPRMMIVARTDAAYAVSPEEAIRRARLYVEAGADAVVATGLADADGYRRLRDAVRAPIFAVVVPGTPWYAPSQDELRAIGIEAVIYPVTVMLHMAAGIRRGLERIADGSGGLPDTFGFGDLAAAVGTADWAAIDRNG